jgi:hypothetical protein
MPVVHSPLVTSILAAIANNQPLVLPPGKQQVFLSFRNCRFDPRMGSLPNTFIAQPTTRGTWTFDQADLHGLRLARAFLFPNNDIQQLKQVLLMVF